MQTRRTIVTIGLLAVLACSIFVLVDTASPPLAAENSSPDASAANHDLYNPARTALVNAQRQLAESSRQEQEILARVRRMHSELDSSLALLANASELDPSMKASIEALRSRLVALQDKPALCPMDRSSSLDAYGKLLEELQALIQHY